jgi:hypothetical protein
VDLCQYPIDRVSPCVKLKSSSTTTDSVPSRKGFWCRRMSPWLQTCFRCWRSLALSRAPWHRACHPTGKGFGVTTCPTASDPLSMREDSGVTTFGQVRRPTGNGFGVATCLVALDPPPSARGLWRHHVWPGRPPGKEWLPCRHVSHGSRPASRCGRALASPRAPWLSASKACLCVPKAPAIRLIMTSPGTRSKQRIKCIQDKPYATYD